MFVDVAFTGVIRGAANARVEGSMGVASMKVFLRQTRGGGDCVKPVNIINVFISTLKFQSVNFLQHNHNRTQAFSKRRQRANNSSTYLTEVNEIFFNLSFSL